MGSRGSSGKETTPFWGQRFLVVVTGASGGIGRAIAVNFAKHVSDKSLFVITGRNTAGLEETKRMIVALGRGIDVSVETCDHSRASFGDYQELLRRASARLATPDRVVLVHNAATMGNNSDYAVSYDSERTIDDYYRLNLTSVMTLTAAFLQHYDSGSGPSRMIVNVSSIVAVEPVQGLALYCTGKAAREMYMRVVALENPSVTVISYDPGAVDTAMLGQAKLGTKECVARVEDHINAGRVMSPEKTASLLIHILEHGNFKSGERVIHSDAPRKPAYVGWTSV